MRHERAPGSNPVLPLLIRCPKLQHAVVVVLAVHLVRLVLAVDLPVAELVARPTAVVADVGGTDRSWTLREIGVPLARLDHGVLDPIHVGVDPGVDARSLGSGAALSVRDYAAQEVTVWIVRMLAEQRATGITYKTWERMRGPKGKIRSEFFTLARVDSSSGITTADLELDIVVPFRALIEDRDLSLLEMLRGVLVLSHVTPAGGEAVEAGLRVESCGLW